MTRGFLIVGLLAFAAAPNVQAQESRDNDLSRFFGALNDAATSGNVDAYAALFVPDAVMFLPNQPPLLGREHIRRWFDDFQRTVTLMTATYEQEHTDIIGDVAIVRSHGTDHYLVDGSGEQIPANHKFVDILRYVDGVWYMLYHIASTYDMEPGLWDRVMSQAFGRERSNE